MVHLGKISEVQTIGFQTPQKHYENQWQICMHFPEGTPLVGAHSTTMRGGREVAFLFFFLLPPLLPIRILLSAFSGIWRWGGGDWGCGGEGGEGGS